MQRETFFSSGALLKYSKERNCSAARYLCRLSLTAVLDKKNAATEYLSIATD